MYYFACYLVTGWYVKTLREKDATFAAKPLCVHRNKRLLDASPEAMAKGVLPGMPLSEAKAILPEGVFQAFRPDPYRDAQKAWLDRLCLFANEVETDEMHRAFVDFTGVPQPEEMAEKARADLERWLGLPVRVGTGPAKWISRHTCGIREGVSLDALPVDRLPISADCAKRLKFLGYPLIRDVVQIPLEQLLFQFGEEGHAIYQSCRGRWQDPFLPSYPPKSLSAWTAPEGGIADLTQLDEALKNIAEELGARLREMDRFGKRVQANLEFEDGRIQTVERVFVKPLDAARPVYFALHTMLGDGFQEPIARVQARLLELERPRRVQRDLSGATDAKERSLSADIALTHLRKTLGDGCVVRGSEWSIPRRDRVLGVWRDATGWT